MSNLEKASKIIVKTKANEFLSNKHNAAALQAIIDNFKVRKVGLKS
jgi:hypothetical protein